MKTNPYINKYSPYVLGLIALICLVYMGSHKVVKSGVSRSSDAFAATYGGAPGFKGVKRGRVYFNARSNDYLKLAFTRIYKFKQYIYVNDPLGRLVKKYAFNVNYGEESLKLGPENGVYEAVVNPNYRYDLTLPSGQAVFQPEPEFPSVRVLNGAKQEYYFYVPPGTTQFTLSVTNQEEYRGYAAKVLLYAPNNSPVETFNLPDIDLNTLIRMSDIPPDKLERYLTDPGAFGFEGFKVLISTKTVTAPAAGFWKVTLASAGSRYTDIGLWLDGVPNYFSVSPGTWFEPKFAGAQAEVSVNAGNVMGDRTLAGVVWDWVSHQEEAKQLFLELGMHADKHYFYPPEDQAPDFGFYDFTMAPLRDAELNLTSLATVCSRAKNDKEFAQKTGELFQFGEQVIDRYLRAQPVGAEKVYWQFLNEPNHKISRGMYAKAYGLFASRVRRTHPEAKLGGPGLGNATGEEDVVNWDWIADLLRYNADRVDFVSWNMYKLDLLEDTWRYGESVDRIRQLIQKYGKGRNPELIIGETNLKGGIVLQTEKQNSFYSALWWASALNNCIGTGKVKMVLYFYLIDQGARQKGLLFADHQKKPVAYAMELYNRFLLDQVVQSASSHQGLEVLATKSADGRQYSLFMVNKTRREIQAADISLWLPEDATGMIRTYRLTEDDGQVVELSGERFSSSNKKVSLRHTLPPESIYVVTLEE